MGHRSRAPIITFVSWPMPRRNRDQVKPPIKGSEMTILPRPKLRGARNAQPSAGRHGLQCGAELRALFDFDKGECRAFSSNDVNLARGALKSQGKDAVAFQTKPPDGDPFCSASSSLCSPAIPLSHLSGRGPADKHPAWRDRKAQKFRRRLASRSGSAAHPGAPRPSRLRSPSLFRVDQ